MAFSYGVIIVYPGTPTAAIQRDVHEVAPVAQRLGLVGRRRADQHERETDRRAAREPPLAGSGRATEVVAADAVGEVGRCGEPVPDLVHPERVELVEHAREVAVGRA